MVMNYIFVSLMLYLFIFQIPEKELEYIENELTKNRKTSHTTAYSPAREFFQRR